MKKKRYDTSRKKRQKTTREDDASMRMTYLWCGAHLLSRTSPNLSRFFTRAMLSIGRRINLSLHPSVKRTICKKCYSPLLTGPESVRNRISKRRSLHKVLTCGNCAAVRRFPVAPSRREKDGQGQARTAPSADVDVNSPGRMTNSCVAL